MSDQIPEPVHLRFLRYAVLDTQSKFGTGKTPSTEKQLVLSKLLLKELKELNIKTAEIDERGNVYAHLPGTKPSIGFLAHIDVSPDAPSFNIKPQIHKNFTGDKIILENGLEINHEVLKSRLQNHDIITSTGETLIGADDKSGIAEIMFMIESIKEIPHNDIYIAFTVDEEIGGGAELDLLKFCPDFAYTVDGSTIGEVEGANFNADSVIIKFKGIGVHPGLAKNKMVNASKVLGKFLSLLPKNKSPETTENLEGYIHPNSIKGDVTESIVKLLVRSFNIEELFEFENLIKQTAKEAIDWYPGSKFEMEIIESYRNMDIIISKHPEVMKIAEKATRNVGIEPIVQSIRGGTDGARITFDGIPCPNLGAGGYNFHSVLEFVSIQDMELISKILINIATLNSN